MCRTDWPDKGLLFATFLFFSSERPAKQLNKRQVGLYIRVSYGVSHVSNEVCVFLKSFEVFLEDSCVGWLFIVSRDWGCRGSSGRKL